MSHAMYVNDAALVSGIKDVTRIESATTYAKDIPRPNP
jgi:hypothetical protein